MKLTLATIALILITSVSALAQAQLNRDPATVKFVTSDIDNFWRAYDLAQRETDKAKRIAIFQTEYLDKGSAGLRDFLRLRIKSAENIVTTIDRLPKFYASIRPATLEVKRMEKRMRGAFKKFKSIYPDAVFPDVYFLIGITSTGGTTGGSGLLIGTELYGRTKSTPNEELPEWLKRVLETSDKLPGIVAHESCHYNQKLASDRTLLAKAISEGSCDLISELISDQNINDKLKPYGTAHEAELWRDFSAEMDKPDFSKWIYNGASSQGRPGDLGYFMGYRISTAYYARVKNKKQAVREILNIQNFGEFLKASGYGEKVRGER